MPKIVDHNLYRKELLDKCFDLFAEKGYASITMREIAQGIGVSTGTLYHYFPSKDALFEQLLEEVSQQTVLMAMTELEGTQTLAERMEVLGKFLERNEDRLIKETYILVDFCQHYGSAALQNSSTHQRTEEQNRQAICALLGISDPALVSFVMSLFQGLILNRLLGDRSISFTEQVPLLGKMLAAYLATRGSSDAT